MTLFRALAAAVVLGGGFFALYELIESPRSEAFAPVLTHGSGHVVALTFDDGPTPGITDRVLDTLERERVRATFFVVGRAARREPGLLRRMAADGDEVENHSDTHAHLNVLAGAALDREIDGAQEAVASAVGKRPRWLRPPFGARAAAVLDGAARRGMRVALWSAMLDETSPNADPATLASRLMANVRDGAIVVLHDGDQGRGDRGERAYEASLTARVIGILRARGFAFVTLDQLAGS